MARNEEPKCRGLKKTTEAINTLRPNEYFEDPLQHLDEGKANRLILISRDTSGVLNIYHVDAHMYEDTALCLLRMGIVIAGIAVPTESSTILESFITGEVWENPGAFTEQQVKGMLFMPIITEFDTDFYLENAKRFATFVNLHLNRMEDENNG